MFANVFLVKSFTARFLCGIYDVVPQQSTKPDEGDKWRGNRATQTIQPVRGMFDGQGGMKREPGGIQLQPSSAGSKPTRA